MRLSAEMPKVGRGNPEKIEGISLRESPESQKSKRLKKRLLLPRRPPSKNKRQRMLPRGKAEEEEVAKDNSDCYFKIYSKKL
jgi:hypothetical protein